MIQPIQEKVLEIFKKSPLCQKFYWTGGTLLSFVYLHHRLSQDLDFFSDKPFSYGEVLKFVQTLKKKLKLSRIEGRKIHDRHEFLLKDKEVLRLEFVLFEHPSLKPRKKYKGILVDSLDDIAANKVMAFFDRNDPKDLFDLYFLLAEKRYKVKELLKLTEKKFGVLFSESTFWSESYKAMKELKTLKPLLLTKTENGKQKLIKKIKEYFISHSTKYLHHLIK